MTFWIATSLLTAVTLIWLMRTYARDDDNEGLSANDVYDAQLSELDREAAEGLLPPGELDSARTEIARRRSRAPSQGPLAAGGGPSRAVAAIVGLFIVAGALALYLFLGRPDLPAQPFALRDIEGETAVRIAPVAGQIEADLAAISDPADRALYLAEVFQSLGAWDDAVASYENALAHRPGDAAALTGIGEVQIIQSSGLVSLGALEWIDAALANAPRYPRAVFYRALYEYQQGAHESALERLDALLATTPGDASWVPRFEDLRARIIAVRTAPAGADQVLGLPEAERQAAIRSMVEGLAARLEDDADDFEGWLTLANARAVLGERQGALAALENATALAAGEPQLLARINAISDQHGLSD